MDRIAPKPIMTVNRKRIDHYLPHQLTERNTPVDTVFTTCSLGIPEVQLDEWSLEITGLVDRSLVLSFDDLKAIPKKELETVYVCSGNPAKPTHPLRRAANVVWGGVDLKTLLDELGVQDRATHLWSYGLDYGDKPSGFEEHYIKDMPLSRLGQGDVMIAYELNGEPLTQKNGFPARLVIPGFYGTNSVKWLCRLELADKRPDSFFTTVLYNDPDYDADPSGKVTKPVWALAPESLIVAPAAKFDIPRQATEIWGWAWSNCAAEKVDVSVDGGETWQEAELEKPNGRAWQRFSLDWTPPDIGPFDMRCRMTDAKGKSQPEDGARNSIHSVVGNVV